MVMTLGLQSSNLPLIGFTWDIVFNVLTFRLIVKSVIGFDIDDFGRFYFVVNKKVEFVLVCKKRMER